MSMNDYLNQKLINDGFVLLDSKDLDIEPSLLKELNKIYNKYRTNPEQYFKSYRNHLQNYVLVESKEKFDKIIQKDSTKNNWFQLWRNCALQHTEKNITDSYLSHIVYKLYGVEKEKYKITSEMTCFTEGCAIVPHQDQGNSKRLCGILNYFSDEWDSSWGGELKVNDNSVCEPILGNIVVFDYTNNNVKHEVSKVIKSNKYRLSLTAFIENYNDN